MYLSCICLVSLDELFVIGMSYFGLQDLACGIAMGLGGDSLAAFVHFLLC